ncbi:MAG: hypothetical protein ACFE85_00365 [Candidatus Hodarchaeota archaeon]
MEIMSEKSRREIIIEAKKYGGITLRHQSLRVHKNGAKFPISKVYLDDEVLNPKIIYSLILIPEAKIATRSSVSLSYFHRKIGPIVFYSYPEDALNMSEKERITEVWISKKDKISEAMVQDVNEGFIVHQSSILSSLNYYFEIPSEWARGNKEILMIIIILNTMITREIEAKIYRLCNDFAAKLKNNKDLFKALYLEEIRSFQDEEQANIRKQSESLRKSIADFYKQVDISTF